MLSSFGLAALGSVATSLFLNGCGSESGFTSVGGSAFGTGSSGQNSATSNRSIVTFVDTLGTVRTVEGMAGKLVAIAPSETADFNRLGQAITDAGGTVVSRVSTVFLVGVTPGTEASVISALQNTGLFLSISPSLSAGPSSPGSETGGQFVVASKNLSDIQIRALDSNQSLDGNCNGATHGQAVSSLSGAGSFTDYQNSPGDGESEQILNGIHDLARRSLFDNTPRVINVSLGGDKFLDGTPASQADHGAQVWMQQVADSLHSHNGGLDAPLDNTVVVVSAGNGFHNAGNQGFDLGATLKGLFDKYPDLAGHLVVVGGSGKPGDCKKSTGVNHATPEVDGKGNPFFISAPSEGVSVPGVPCPFGGTSAAAPQVSAALRQALADSNQSVRDTVIQFLKDNEILCNPFQGTWSGTDTVSISDSCGFSFTRPASVTFVGTISGSASLPTFSYVKDPCGNLSTGATTLSVSGSYPGSGGSFTVNFGAAGSGTGSFSGTTMSITLNGTSADGSPVTNVLALTKQP